MYICIYYITICFIWCTSCCIYNTIALCMRRAFICISYLVSGTSRAQLRSTMLFFLRLKIFTSMVAMCLEFVSDMSFSSDSMLVTAVQ